MTDWKTHSGYRCYVIIIALFYSLQSIADDEVFLPSDEIWVYDLERGVW